jgi:hypothetical protein
MKIKFGIRYLILPIIITLFLLIPENVVWGGHSFQTVPTIGPSSTPTRTQVFTATQSIRTQNPVIISTSTSVLISPLPATVTSNGQPTQDQVSQTSEPEKTETISETSDPTQPESTSVVVLPVVSNGDSAPGDPSNQDENSPIPAFVFPLVVVLLFVIIYLTTRLSLKKSLDEKSTQNNK